MIPPLATALYQQGIISRVQHEALSAGPRSGIKALLSQIASDTGLSLSELTQELATFYQLPVVDASHVASQMTSQWTDSEWRSSLHRSPLTGLMQDFAILPLHIGEHDWHLASYDPSLKGQLAEWQFHHHVRIQLSLMPLDQFESLCLRLKQSLPDSLKPSAADEPGDLFEQMIGFSRQHQASDIHIEQYQHHARVRIRRDGLLQQWQTLPREQCQPLISRIKVLADLDITEQRLPQDGRLKWQSRTHPGLDMRISTLPTLWGEKIVIRMASGEESLTGLEQLGLTSPQLSALQLALNQPQGLILVTGPTGSGKTRTLYACLQALHNDNLNISTAEDPVEIHIEGFNQIQVNKAIDFNFAGALRALLRQDPDIIMLGEIRDTETAQIALRAAQTGHLVLSTLHTNSAFDTLHRLQSLGVSTGELEGCLRLIMAQRLIRTTCTHCQTVSTDAGCAHCYQGYAGRKGIFELLPINRDLLQLLAHRTLNEEDIHQALIEQQSLRAVATSLYRDGKTTQSEIDRVLGHAE